MCLIVNVLQIITAAVFTVSCELPTSGSYRNGSKSQEMLPLWKWEKGGKFPVRPVDVVASDTPYRNGSKSRETVPLWMWEKGGKFPVWSVDVVVSDTPYRNGSKSRETVLLWKWEMVGKCPVRLVNVVASDAPCRNGSKSGEMLPLWIGRRAGASGTVSCEPWKEPVVQDCSVYRPTMRACWGPTVRTGPVRVPRPSTEMRPSRQ